MAAAESNRLLLLLSIAAVLVVAQDEAGVGVPRVHLMLGTTPSGEDVMKDGVVLAPWNVAHGANVGANSAMYNFYATFADATGSEQVTLTVRQPPSGSYEVKLPSPIIQVIGGTPPYPVTVPVQFECIRNNTNAPETTSMDLSMQGPYDVATVFFDKTCTWPMLNIGMNEVTGSIYHLGQPVDFTYVAFPDDDNSRFYLWLDDTNTYDSLTYNVKELTYDTSVISIQQSINEPVARKFKPGSPESSIFLEYKCLNTLATSQTFVHILLNIGWKTGTRDVQWVWTKRCSASHSTHARPGFDIGTSPGLGDVIKNGVVSKAWYPEQMHLDYDTQRVTFYVFINGTDIGMNPPTQVFNLTVTTAGSVAPYDIAAGNLTGATASVGSYVIVDFAITCRVAGMSNTRIDVSIPAYGVGSFFFDKTCTYPKLQIGTSEHNPDIVKDSVLQPWRYDEHEATTTKFYLWLPRGDAVAKQHFTISNFYYDASIMSASPRIEGDNVARPLDLGTPEASITWFYQCYDTAAGKSGDVNMTIDIGWAGASGRFAIAWHKACGGGPGPQPGGGWSAFGIFAFTVFLLTLIGCVGGCIYNYFGPSGKRGLSVIPGHSYYKACYDKIVTPKSYTPQTSSDYTYNAAEEKSGGHAYQTDL